MDNIILFDDDLWDHLLPLTFTRPVCELRTGILTIREKWAKHFGLPTSHITQDYLSEKYPIQINKDNLLINGSLLPTEKLLVLIKDLEENEALLDGDQLLVARLGAEQFDLLMQDKAIDELSGMDISGLDDTIDRISRPYDLFVKAKDQLIKDYRLLTKGRSSQPLSATNTVIGDRSQVFVEAGASVECAMLNVTAAPIYVGKGATIMEGSMIREGLGLCDHSTVKMGAKLYGTNTIGPHSKVGGEMGNSVIIGYSNKGHEGYLGNSVLGEWCNLGADTNTSNLKNNYTEVKLWDYVDKRFAKTGLQFCGLIMGDHSKSGINSMFNTGTVVGVACNIFGHGYPRNYIPSYSWGGATGFVTNKVEKAAEVAQKVMARRALPLTEVDVSILRHIFLATSTSRVWEKA